MNFERLSFMKHIPTTIASLILLLTLNACVFQDTKPKVPENLVSIDDMAQFLADAHLAEAIADMDRIEEEKPDQKYVDYFNYLLKKYALDKEELLSSFEYYLSDPPLMEQIYEQVNEILMAKKNELKSVSSHKNGNIIKQ